MGAGRRLCRSVRSWCRSPAARRRETAPWRVARAICDRRCHRTRISTCARVAGAARRSFEFVRVLPNTWGNSSFEGSVHHGLLPHQPYNIRLTSVVSTNYRRYRLKDGLGFRKIPCSSSRCLANSKTSCATQLCGTRAMDHLIDDVARLLAADMPRRRLFGLVGGVFATAFFAMFAVEPLSASSCSKAQKKSGSRTCSTGDDEHGDDRDEDDDDRDRRNNNSRGGEGGEGGNGGGGNGGGGSSSICCPPNTCCAAAGRKLACCGKGTCVCSNGTCAPSSGARCPSGCKRC